MTIFLPKVKSFGEEFGAAIGGGLGEGFEKGREQKQKLAELAKEDEEIFKATGVNLRGHTDPEIRKMRFKSEIEAKEKNTKLNKDFESNKKTRDVIENMAGKEVADLWESATEGGKTEILKTMFEAGKRNIGVNDFLNISNKNSEDLDKENNLQGNIQNKKIPTKTIDFDKGLTPKERVQRQEGRYSKNLPLFQESQTKRSAYDIEAEELNILEELSPQIGGMARLNINPSSGEIIFPGFASPEVQRFAKTVNDFTTRAKDSYGSRVTNFDLTQFMRRLPTLANSEEGRTQIIQQMKILNDINRAYETSLHEVIDEHGGIRNIDYDQAEMMANKRAKPAIDNLKSQFKNIGKQTEKAFEKNNEERKKITPKGKVAVEKADGTQGYISKDKLEKFLKIPGNKAL